MSLLDDLAEGLHAAQNALAGLGPRPKGDVAGLKALAKAMRQEADTVAAAGRLESSIPASIVFDGPAGKQFSANVDQVAESLFVAQRSLDAAAEAIARKAREIAEAQADYDHARKDLADKVSELGRRLAHTPK